MSVGDYVILAIIAVWFIVAVWFLIRQHRQGKSACGGGGGCAGCHGGGTKNRDRSKGVAADNAASVCDCGGQKGNKGCVAETKENNCGCTGGSGCAGCSGCHSGKNG